MLVRVAALTGADTVGFEWNRDLAAIGRENIRLAATALAQQRLTTGRASSITADATQWPLPLPTLDGIIDVFVFIDNIAFGNDLTAKMIEALVRDDNIPVTTRIMLTEPLLWEPRDRDRVELFRRLSTPTFYTTPINVTSWAPSRPLVPVVYTKSERNASIVFVRTFGDAYTKALRERPSNRVPVLAR
jgi:hypothetical protein